MNSYLLKRFGLRTLTMCLIAFFFFSSLIAIPASCQTKETPDTVRFKVLGCLYRSIQALNNRNVRFKALQEELENMHPLQPENMDSSHFAANLAQVAKYLLFLQSHRTQIGKNIRIFADSVHLLSALMNKEEEKKALVNFMNAYKDESAAFINYSQRLSLMLTEIRSALVFLQTVPMERKGNEVTFNTDKSANDKYMDFQSRISIDQTQVDNAIDRSIKLTERENKVIQETITLLNK